MTARDRLTWVRPLLKYGCDPLGYLPKHPWVGLDIKVSHTNKSRPWAPSELTPPLPHAPAERPPQGIPCVFRWPFSICDPDFVIWL